MPTSPKISTMVMLMSRMITKRSMKNLRRFQKTRNP